MLRSLPDSHYYATEACHAYNLDIPNREIYLVGEESEPQEGYEEPGIEYRTANRLIRNLRLLTTDDNYKSILIHLKSCGGSWEEGMAIYDAIKACPTRVVIVNYTHARSMTSLILQAADWRVMMPNSYFMFHDGTFGTDGHWPAVKSQVRFTEQVADPTMMNIYIESLQHKGVHKEKTRSQLKAMLRRKMDRESDVFLTAEQAVEWGFADEVFKCGDSETNRNAWAKLKQD